MADVRVTVNFVLAARFEEGVKSRMVSSANHDVVPATEVPEASSTLKLPLTVAVSTGKEHRYLGVCGNIFVTVYRVGQNHSEQRNLFRFLFATERNNPSQKRNRQNLTHTTPSINFHIYYDDFGGEKVNQKCGSKK